VVNGKTFYPLALSLGVGLAMAGNGLARAGAAPTKVVATPVSSTEVNLTWNRAGTGETALLVERKTTTGWVGLVELPAGSNLFTDTSCFSRQSYSYRVRAVYSSGHSDPSPEARATTPAAEGTLRAVTGLTAEAADAWTVRLTWSDANTEPKIIYLIERSADGVSYTVVKAVHAPATSWEDSPVLPGTTYSYRIRCCSPYPKIGDYAPPVEVKTLPRPGGIAPEAANLRLAAESAGSVTLAWDDNAKGTAAYQVETATSIWKEPQWQPAGRTAVGATSFSVPVKPESFLWARVRPVTSAGRGGPTAPLAVRTASPRRGSPKTFEIGPGKSYPTLASLDWTALGPGDVVNIHPGIYKEKVLLTARGTADHPIVIQGVGDEPKNPVVLEGDGATTAGQFATSWVPLEKVGLFLVGTRRGQMDGYQPGHLVLRNMELRNAYTGDKPGSVTFTNSAGKKETYEPGAAGVYLVKGDHILLEGLTVHHNGNGIFGASQSGENRRLSDITLSGCHIYANGNPGRYREHNVYLEAFRVTYEHNRFGSPRPGSLGCTLKDRSVGTLIRHNTFERGGHMIDLVETQNAAEDGVADPAYHVSRVYENTFTSDPGKSTPMTMWIHYGGDNGITPFYRKGVLYFWDNRVVCKADQADGYRQLLLGTATPADAVDCRRNVVHFAPPAGRRAPEMDMLPAFGVGYFADNWLSPGWSVTQIGKPFTGKAANLAESTRTNAANNPPKSAQSP
jgi:hypothetical protein